MSLHIMWFRKDLRLEDNTALYHALDHLTPQDTLLCVFHLDENQFKIGEKSHDYFFSALEAFTTRASQVNLSLHFLTGDLFDAFATLKQDFPTWEHIYFNFDNRGYGQKRDLSMTALFESQEVHVHSYEEHHLHEAESVLKPDGSPYKKFTPYYKKWIMLPKPLYQKKDCTLYASKLIQDTESFSQGEKLFHSLLSQRKEVFTGQVGEAAATDQLNHFILNDLEAYDKRRDYPSVKGTSRLSPYLATGTLSIRKVWQACFNAPSSNGKDTFLKELAWRDFYHMIYHFNPNQYQEELIEKYRTLQWQRIPDLLAAWEQGKTGYPIIDAAMRQLNETGWMHNRLRMLVASFLTKDLLIDWRLGERYFSRQLIDYDSASNIGGWQWAASTGTDAVPYFRIFNPTTQGLKFDQEGTFIKKYVPELAHLPTRFLHEPHLMSLEEQQRYGCELGKDYPLPIVEHKEARLRALDWFGI